jgi:hypothetical protein
MAYFNKIIIALSLSLWSIGAFGQQEIFNLMQLEEIALCKDNDCINKKLVTYNKYIFLKTTSDDERTMYHYITPAGVFNGPSCYFFFSKYNKGNTLTQFTTSKVVEFTKNISEQLESRDYKLDEQKGDVKYFSKDEDGYHWAVGIFPDKAGNKNGISVMFSVGKRPTLQPRIDVGGDVGNLKIMDEYNSLKGLNEYNGKVVTLVQWSSWCKYSRESMIKLRKFYYSLSPRQREQLAIVFVDSNEDLAIWKNAITDSQLDFGEHYQEGENFENNLSLAFNKKLTPFFTLISQDNKKIASHEGLLDDSFLKDIKSLLPYSNNSPSSNTPTPKNTLPVVRNTIQKDWIGGNTPEDLAKILLKALVNNDKQTWAKTVLPLEKTVAEDNNDYAKWAEWHINKRFDLIRENLIGEGVTNWSLVEFSRVIYQPMTDDKGMKMASGPTIEFTYKNKEFIGTIGFAIFYSKSGKYYVPGVQPRIMSKGELRRYPKY